MNQVPANYFQTFGALDKDAESYIERPADRALLKALKESGLCLVLAPRQTGKSSLMVHSLQVLEAEAPPIRGAIVDCQRLGSVADIGELFGSITSQIAYALGLDTDPGDWWEANKLLFPTERFVRFLTDVVLAEVSEEVTLFFDEIDTILTRPFSDDFFTTIRSLYIARANDTKLRRVDYALLGTATATQLIKDRNRTPFNVGVSIALEDFDRSLLAAYERVLGGNGKEIVDRIFYWTNGQPMMVQRLAAAAAAWPLDQRTSLRLDEEVASTYLQRKIENDTHFSFIQNYLLANQLEASDNLRLYDRILERGYVELDNSSIEQSRLRIAGVVSIADDRLVVRNRIYAHVFSPEWVSAQRSERALADRLTGWLNSGKSVDFLLYGEALEAMLDWSRNRRDTTEDEREYLQRSQERQLQNEKERAERIASKYRTQRRFTVAMVTASAVLCGLLAIAIYQYSRAQTNWRDATASARSAKASAVTAKNEADRANFEAKNAVAARRKSEQSEALAKESLLKAQKSEKAAADLARLAESLRHRAEMAAGQAKTSAKNEHAARIVAQEARVKATRLFYLANLNAVNLYWDSGNIDAISSLLTETKDDSSHFEWGYWWRISHQSKVLPESDVKDIAISHDGTLMSIVTRSDGAVLVDARTLKSLWSIPDCKIGILMKSAFSPDGKRLAVSGSYGLILYDIVKRRLVEMRRASQRGARDIAFSPDGKQLLCINARTADAVTASPICDVLSVSDMKTVRSIPSNGPAPNETPKGATSLGFAAVSPDGRRVLIGSWKMGGGGLAYDGAASIWDSSGKLICRLSGKVEGVQTASFSPDLNRVVTGDRDGGVRIWDAVTGKENRNFTGHSGAVTDITVSADGKLFATAGADKLAKVWDFTNGTADRALKGHRTPVSLVRFLLSDSTLATGSTDGVVRLWDWKNAVIAERHSLADHDVLKIAFSPNGKMVALGSENQGLVLYFREEKRSLPLVDKGKELNAITFSKDNQLVACATIDGKVRVWRTADGFQLQELPKGRGQYLTGALSVAVSDDHKFVAGGYTDGTVLVWRTNSGDLVHTLGTLDKRENSAETLDFSPSGDRIAVGRWDGTADIRYLNGTTAPVAIAGHKGLCTSIVFSNDGTRVATASSDRTARVWLARSGASRLTLTGHTGTIDTIGFSPDDTRVVTAARDRTIRVWDDLLGRQVLSLEADPDRRILAVQFISGSNQLLAGDSKGELYAWNGADLRVQSGLSHVTPMSTLRRLSAIRRKHANVGR